MLIEEELIGFVVVGVKKVDLIVVAFVGEMKNVVD